MISLSVNIDNTAFFIYVLIDDLLFFFSGVTCSQFEISEKDFMYKWEMMVVFEVIQPNLDLS